ncbi:hypothetical protein BYT27DRAFT_7194625 [Phlegmacium glaucopus]|nr:hypothetical protein BYT27DRAFT_7194625 [Phlegmacium glaucopus]
MFSRIRAQQPAALLRRAQNVLYPIKISTQGLTTTAGVRQNHKDHTPDSYSKEVDRTPPSDQKIHRVDPDSDLVQKPYEAPSGEWSRAGIQTEAYRSVEAEKQPYAPIGGENSRYGAGKSLAEDKGPETSKSDEGPDRKSSHGRQG